jgi:hypothetical protein
MSSQKIARNVIAHVTDDWTKHRVLKALTHDDKRVTITHYNDGFVPLSYRYKKTGDCTITIITADNVTVAHDKYDMKRAEGKALKTVITIAKAGQKRGRIVPAEYWEYK